jgi:hydrogenase expression/formation protein HypE
LAICGTVNDLAMVGAIPKYITTGFILEEGLEVDTLERIVESMRATARQANVQIIAGDTKVVQKGKADGVFITTAGFGVIPATINIRGSLAEPGDLVILSGSLGEHGIAVLAARGDLGFETDIESDVAPLNGLIQFILENTQDIHAMRDPTRGGLATTLNEIAAQSKVCIRILEDQVPIKPAVQAACEILGFDPLYIANEGKFILIAPPKAAEIALNKMKDHPLGCDAQVIGEVRKEPAGKVLMKTNFGSTRILDMLSGELLPRIC